MDLIRKLNEETNKIQTKDDLFESNVILYSTDAEVDPIDLTESIIDWLGQFIQDAQEGKLAAPTTDNTAALADHTQSIQNKISIMGAVMALTDPDTAEAMNVKNPSGILKIAASNDPNSDKALDYLMKLGKSSAQGFSKKAAEMLKTGDKEALVQSMTNLQNQAKKLILIKNPPQQQAQAPGKMGLADKMAEKPTI